VARGRSTPTTTASESGWPGHLGQLRGAQPFTAGDLDGDGADEVLLVNADTPYTPAGDDALWVLPRARYTEDADLDEVVEVRLVSPVSGELSAVQVAGDVDADGTTDLLVGRGDHAEDGVYRGAATVLRAPRAGDAWDDVGLGPACSPPTRRPGSAATSPWGTSRRGQHRGGAHRTGDVTGGGRRRRRCTCTATWATSPKSRGRFDRRRAASSSAPPSDLLGWEMAPVRGPRTATARRGAGSSAPRARRRRRGAC